MKYMEIEMKNETMFSNKDTLKLNWQYLIPACWRARQNRSGWSQYAPTQDAKSAGVVKIFKHEMRLV